MLSAFDYTGWLIVFAFGIFISCLMVALYLRESRGPRRPYYMSRYRWGIPSALFLTLLAALRRFVFHV